MNPEEQQEFERLRKLMALKRHEQPPPQYLSQLHDRIINRIEGGEGRQNFWDRLTANFVLRPGLVYAFGLTVCGALGVTGVAMVRQEMMEASDTVGNTFVRGQLPQQTYAAQLNPSANTTEEPTLHVANWLRNTNPTVETQPRLSLFTAAPTVMPVAYHTGN